MTRPLAPLRDRNTCDKEGDDNHAIWLESNKFIEQKLDYVHQNPVNEELVAHAQDYLFSSAGDYAGRPGLVKVELL